MAKLFEGAAKNWRFVLKFLVLSTIFWAMQFAFQYYVLVPGELGGALVRSFALSGATFIGLALLSSSFFKFKPKYAQYWYVRRSLGVMGFVFISFHVFSVVNFLFGGNPLAAYYSLNPFENPIIFGAIAYPIFFLMAITSTDWAVEKLGMKKWKNIHRAVYFAYYASIFHFITINPTLLANPAGYLLLTVTFLAVLGQLYWFLKTAGKYNFRSTGTLVGIVLIALYLGTAYIVFFAPKAQQAQEDSLEASVQKMKESMEKRGGDKSVLTTHVAEDQGFSGEMEKQGAFQSINYMTSGSAKIEKKNETYFVVFGDDFSTPNGPDLVVYLTKNSSPTTREDIKKGLLLGELKSTVGKQVYELPGGTSIGEYNSLSIHCRAFNVPWSYAELK